MKKYKRQEGFRFVFNVPVDAQFAVLVNGKRQDLVMHPCKIIDISPRGMKIYTESHIANITKYANELLQFEIHFILDVTKIKAVGHVRWSKPYGTGSYFGLFFRDQPEIEELIISEMKRRRRKEVFANRYIDFKSL